MHFLVTLAVLTVPISHDSFLASVSGFYWAG